MSLIKEELQTSKKNLTQRRIVTNDIDLDIHTVPVRYNFGDTAYVDKLSREGSRLNRLLTRGASDREIIEELYLVTVSRLPTQKEFLELKQLVQQADSRQNAFEDLFWGLVASREFSYNH